MSTTNNTKWRQYIDAQTMQKDQEVAQPNVYFKKIANLCHKQEMNL